MLDLKQPGLKRDFSYCEEAQAYMGDRNINIQDSVMSIITKKEHVTAPAWHEKKGFTMHDFDYTSAVVNTGGIYSMSEDIEGLVESSSNMGVFSLSPKGLTSYSYMRSSSTEKQDEILAIDGKVIAENGLTAE